MVTIYLGHDTLLCVLTRTPHEHRLTIGPSLRKAAFGGGIPRNAISEPYPLNLGLLEPVFPPVIEPGRSRARMRGHVLRVFQRAAVFQKGVVLRKGT